MYLHFFPLCIFLCINFLLIRRPATLDEGPPYWPHLNLTSAGTLFPNKVKVILTEIRNSTCLLGFPIQSIKWSQ
jgi:hypothetical protein